MNFKIHIIFLLFIITILSCKKEDTEPIIPVIDYSYFPLTVDNYVIYNVTKINIDKPLEIYDTTEYQLKEIIESEYIGLSGRTEYRLERYIRTNDTISWQISDVWFMYIDNNRAIKVEENIPYIKILFPVEEDNYWDGNNFNSLDSLNYTISELNFSDSINSNYFDNLIKIEQIDEESLIDKKQSYEIYAKDIGLTEKIEIDINSQPVNGEPIDINVPIEQRITTGTIYKQKIISHK